jgi:hypothetical protein
MVLGTTLMLASGTVLAQPRQAAPDLGPDLTPAEVQRLFDAFVLVQAQESLELSDDQFAPFVSKLKRLQELRRRNQQEEQRLLRAVQRLETRQEASDEEIETRLGELDDHHVRAAEAVRAAYADIDSILALRQRVRLRVFEQRMERRKLQLVMRAGQARPAQPTQRRPRANPPR